ncbi:MAG: ATP-binding protein [Lachnospiraceae bacterium]|nr:ATP-binding protein [Lachnospiraceae bacterium]
MFLGREDELKLLEEKYQSKGGQLLIVYGRRRVGKTEMLRKFCENKEHVFYACAECPDEKQLALFGERILHKGIPASKYLTRFSDWQQAFESIAELPGDGKKLLVIDEFPYMVKNNASIPSVLQNLWDARLKDENVMIILCGSAMSFMEKEILAEKNPLYGRATGILKMREMDVYDAVKFLPNYSPLEKITAYAVLGGIPHYLKQFDDRLSIAENIQKNILTRGSILYSEVEFLMRQELRETSVYNAIIEAIALGNTKLNGIYQKTQIERSKLSAYLRNLMDLGIICREFSVDDGVKEQANVQRGIYQVTDNFFRFWYAFVFPNGSELESGDHAGVWKYEVEPELDRYVSLTFESVCRQFLRRENRRENLPFRYAKIGRWWNKTEELDILAVDRRGENYLIGECKYKNSPFTFGDMMHMQKKFLPKREDSGMYYFMFSKSGFAEEVKRYAKENGLFTVGPDDLGL